MKILSASKTVLITSITIAYTSTFCHTDFEHTWNVTNILNLELYCFFSNNWTYNLCKLRQRELVTWTSRKPIINVLVSSDALKYFLLTKAFIWMKTINYVPTNQLLYSSANFDQCFRPSKTIANKKIYIFCCFSQIFLVVALLPATIQFNNNLEHFSNYGLFR